MNGCNQGRIGSHFSEFLDEQGIREEIERQALAELKAEQIAAAEAVDHNIDNR